MEKVRTACVTVAALLAALSSSAETKVNWIPAGAAAAGCTKCVVNERPHVRDISPDGKGDFKWFSGHWYSRRPPTLDFYRMENGALCIEARADGHSGNLTSAPHDWPEKGLVPFLPAKDGFYVEFDCQLDSNDPDHFAAVWLNPAEKRRGHPVVHEGDAPNYERWMELDVDEAGFGPGSTCTVHNWYGKFPDYLHILNPNNVVKKPLDRTQRHRFGASYSPKTRTVTWWLDDKFVVTARDPYVPASAEDLNYFFIFGAQMHAKHVPYRMYVYAIRAFAPQSSALPAVPYDIPFVRSPDNARDVRVSAEKGVVSWRIMEKDDVVLAETPLTCTTGGRDVCTDVQLGVPTRRNDRGNVLAVPLVDAVSQKTLSVLEVRVTNKAVAHRFVPGSDWTEAKLVKKGKTDK